MSEQDRWTNWLDELEVYSTRRERIPDGAMPWIKEAWNIQQRHIDKLEIIVEQLRKLP